MKLGLHLSRWKWDDGPSGLAPRLRQIAQLADEVGFASLSVMDHFFQIPSNGEVEDPMLEAYTALGFLAACTSRMQLGTVVTSATYRHPGVLIKQVTTLDVLSQGRAFLGIGAGFYEREHLGLGIRLPPVAERMQRLEETLQIAMLMWSGDAKEHHGRHYDLQELLNVPAPIQRPHPPILVGGGGEKKTLRIAAQYANAVNLFGGIGIEQLQHKLNVLRQHCEQAGRDFDGIEKTVQVQFDVMTGPDSTKALIERLREFAALGFTRAIGSVRAVETLKPLEVLGRDVIPQIEPF
jgi:F420-dependent oxidoreductase-like protein